jgi:hypothetical protein
MSATVRVVAPNKTTEFATLRSPAMIAIYAVAINPLAETITNMT